MIDLHCHSLFSDGDLTANELLKKAEELQLTYFSITDHNNCMAYENLDINNFTGNLVPGVEMVTSFDKHIIEVLGYGVNTKKINEWYYKKNKDHTKFIYDRLIDIFNKKGIYYTRIYNIDETLKAKPKQYFYKDLLKYEGNKEIIGIETLSSFANFNKKGLNNPNSILFINECEMFPSLHEIVQLIHQEGGLCFIAHLYQYNIDNHIEFIEKIRNAVDIDGVETYHSSFTKEQITEINTYADKNNLYKCGGSDYHGSLKPGIKLGLNLEIPDDLIKPWISKVRINI